MFSKKPGPKGPFLLSEISETEKTLVAKLAGSEHWAKMNGFLKSLLFEFRCEDNISQAFTFEYNEKTQSFAINPVNASIDAIKKDIGKLLLPENPGSKCTPQ